MNSLVATLEIERGIPADASSSRAPADLRIEVVADQGAVLGRFDSGSGLALAVFGSGCVRLAASPDEAAAVLAERWQAGGVAGLDEIDDLVAVVADSSTGTLAVVAGPGPHRLFVGVDRGRSVHVSNRVSVVAHRVAAVTDRGYEDFLLAYGFLPEGRTTYAGIRALAPGTVTLYPGGDTRPIAADPVDVRGDAVADTARALDPSAHLLTLLMDAVERQAGSAREHAVLLGGFDSALVVALLRRLGHRVHAFTFGFGDPAFDQANIDLVVETQGCEHTWIPIAPAVIGSGLQEFASVYSQPVSQPHYLLHTLEASRVVRAHGFDRVFTGDGCDAAFLGFPTVNRRARSVALGARLPPAIARMLLRASEPRVLERHLGQGWRLGRGMLEALTEQPPVRGHLPFAVLGELSRSRLRVDGPPQQAEPILAIRLRLAEGTQHLDPTRRAFHGHALTGQSAAKVDGAVAVTGVAQCSPYLDPGVREFARALPTELLRPDGSGVAALGKDLLMRTVLDHELLPRAVVLQPKQSPSTSPVDRWYSGPLRPLVLECLEGLPFEWDRRYVEDLLRPKRAEDLYRRRISLDQYAFRAIGLLLTYASFARNARGAGTLTAPG